MAIKLKGITVIDDADNLIVDQLIIQKEMYEGARGRLYGYVAGGDPTTNRIQLWPLSAGTTNASDVGDLTQSREHPSSVGSDDYGYAAGGTTGIGSNYNIIDRWPFTAATTDAADVGDLTQSQYSNQSGVQSNEYGHQQGGNEPTGAPEATKRTNIDRWPFAAATVNARDIGDLSSNRYGTCGVSSEVYGYSMGGRSSPPDVSTTTIGKFPFAEESITVTNVGTLTENTSHFESIGGIASGDYGYCVGGFGPTYNNITRFPFASDGTASDLGAGLTGANYACAGISSVDNGYCAGGANNPPAVVATSVIQRFPFASGTPSSSDVGDLIATVEDNSGTEV